MVKLKKLLENKAMLFLVLCLIRIMLDVIYCRVVSPYYSYLGLTITLSSFRLIGSWFMFFVYCILISIITNDDSEKHKGSVVLTILLCCSAIPTTTIVAYFDVDLKFIIYNTLYWTMLVFFYRLKFKRVSSFSFIRNRNRLYVYIISFIYMLAVFFICIKYTGIEISFDLSKVYEVRTAFKSDSIPIILQYLFFSSTVVFPILLAYGLNRKNKLLIILTILFQLIAFFADGRKSTLFMLIITILGYYFIKKLNNKLIPFGIVIIIFFGYLEYRCFNTTFVIVYFIRRLFLLPAYLQYAYYDFFSVNSKDFLNQSIMGRLGRESIYNKPIPQIIGQNYYGGSYANNGLFSDAFSNFGVLGIILFPAMIAFSLKYLDKCSRGLSLGLCIGVILTTSFSLLSTSFFTVMLTHGFIICCIVIDLIPRFSQNSLRKKQE